MFYASDVNCSLVSNDIAACRRKRILFVYLMAPVQYTEPLHGQIEVDV